MPIPPSGAREEAQRGLDWRKEYGRGGTPVGWARARDLSNGVDIPPATLRRMVSFFARHEVDKQGQGYRVGSEGYPSRGRIAWALWGGDAGRAWALSQTQRMEKTMTELEPTRRPALLRKLRITRVDRVATGANPDAEIVLFKQEAPVETQKAGVVGSILSPQETIDHPTNLEDSPMSEATTLEVEATEAAGADGEFDALAAERDALAAKVAVLEAQVATSEAVIEATEEVDVLKGIDPVLRDRIVKAETERAALSERVAKMEDDAATLTFIAKAAEFKVVEADSEVLGSILKDVGRNCSAETVAGLETILKSSSLRLSEATKLITAEIGSVAGLDSTDAGQRIESLAKARSAESGESMPVATAAILNENPDLYEQARAQRAN